MQAAEFMNPFWQNQDVGPVVIVHEDASYLPPHDMVWTAMVTSMPVGTDPETFDVGMSGFPVRNVHGESDAIEAGGRQELLCMLEDAGFGALDLFEVRLGRIHGESTQEHLGKVSELAQATVPGP